MEHNKNMLTHCTRTLLPCRYDLSLSLLYIDININTYSSSSRQSHQLHHSQVVAVPSQMKIVLVHNLLQNLRIYRPVVPTAAMPCRLRRFLVQVVHPTRSYVELLPFYHVVVGGCIWRPIQWIGWWRKGWQPKSRFRVSSYGVIRSPFGDISKENAKHRPDRVPKKCVPECVPEPLRPL